jgi:tol-pal system-associated acyl-CoA thioesterase
VGPHRLPIKVYLEDTDAQGIVYHASYVRFCERGRTEYCEALGTTAPESPRLVVHELRVKYRKPARLGDRLEVTTSARLASPYRLTFHQRVARSGEDGHLVEATVEVACTDAAGRLIRMPEDFVKLIVG